jgi:hypothetical protein
LEDDIVANIQSISKKEELEILLTSDFVIFWMDLLSCDIDKGRTVA